MLTIQQALTAGYQQLVDSSTPRLDAQILLCHVLDVEKPYLITHTDQVLTASQHTRWQALLARRAQGEPIAYLLGYKDFWDLRFAVSSAVLIPRPETEHLIETALAWLKGQSGIHVVDVGTGSGAIAVTVAKHSTVTMHAVDISADALAIARANAEHHGVAVQFYQGSLAQPLLDQQQMVHLLLANLPYIASDEVPQLAVSVHEPPLALDGGVDGLDLLRALLRQVPQVCHPGALILLEIGNTQAQAVLDEAHTYLSLKEARIITDLAGLDRIIYLQL
ncbi:MAG: peptide chain release factor N(5)-glutamine methyltransferase [Anaerolineae bacterium]